MSYSFNLKSSFFDKKIKKCCLKSQLCGMMAFLPVTQDLIRISSEYIELLEYYNFIFSEILSYKFDIYKNGKLNYLELSSSDFNRLFNKIGFIYSGIKTAHYSDPLNSCCFSSFLRGVFFTTGTISSPDVAYQLEFRTYNNENAEILLDILKRKNMQFKQSKRNSKPIIYTKSADTIKDFLAEIGAVDFMFDYTNTAIEKKLRNDINRHSNCDSANIDRIIEAASNSIKSIEFLENNGYFENLSDELKEIALLRKTDATETLEQIGIKCNPPISKNQAFRRIKKICLLADKYKKEGKF